MGQGLGGESGSRGQGSGEDCGGLLVSGEFDINRKKYILFVISFLLETLRLIVRLGGDENSCQCKNPGQ